MIEITHLDMWGLDHAVMGMRNPLNSWDKSDSHYTFGSYIVGENDLKLMKRLYRAGSEHRKYLRQIFVSIGINAPLYWWKEFDTYKVGTAANSCSTMHTIHCKEFELDDFSHEHLNDECENRLYDVILTLNDCRDKYLETRNKSYWWQMIQLLPSSYNQKRTVSMNYENAVNMILQRSGHKLDEWNKFTNVLKELPYLADIMGE